MEVDFGLPSDDVCQEINELLTEHFKRMKKMDKKTMEEDWGLPKITNHLPMPKVKPPKNLRREPHDLSCGLYVDAGDLDKKLLEKELNEELVLPEEKSI